MENIDYLIEERVIERQRKLQFIAEQMAKRNARNSSHRNWYVAASAIAAVVVVALIVAPFFRNDSDLSSMSLTGPQFEDFRGGGDAEIETALARKDYKQALGLLDTEIPKAEAEISALENNPEDSSEYEYSLSLARDYYAELLWAKIYAMVKLDDNDGLKPLVKSYLSLPGNLAHVHEAQAILANL